MRKTTKCMTVMTAATVMLLGSFSVSYAATGWQQETVDRQTIWHYYDNSGNMLKNSWLQSPASGLWYFFDQEGVMVTGWGEGKAEGYWFDASGAMATGWREVPLEDDDTYGPGASSGEKGYFYFGTSGMVMDGWQRINGSWYFLNNGYADDFADYQMVYGEVAIDGDEYYFGESNDGSMKYGLVKVISETNANTPSSTKTESYYLYKDNGVRVLSGWGRYNSTWYYVSDDTGEVVTDSFVALDSNDYEVEIDSPHAKSIYYMDNNGVMKTGWLQVGEDTEVRPGVTKGKVTYYFNEDGTMHTGWKKDGSKWYYLLDEADEDNGYARGQMLNSGVYTIAGKTYYFNTNGDMATATWKTVEVGATDYSCYFGSDGVMYAAPDSSSYLLEKIGSKYYAFDEYGHRLENTTIYYVDNKWQVMPAASVPDGTIMYTINRSGVASKGTYRK